VVTVTYAHIKHNSEGEPIVEGTRIMVRTIALDLIAHGWDAEEIQRHHPGESGRESYFAGWQTTPARMALT
jgi:hypothetical protein